mmetsp:Transcript_30138/g.48188  ORF Transcript_30138/g.48188 Transcript_30138/m.48188 type:complete len:205 (+) Transcript_30138:329-943(+)
MAFLYVCFLQLLSAQSNEMGSHHPRSALPLDVLDCIIRRITPSTCDDCTLLRIVHGAAQFNRHVKILRIPPNQKGDPVHLRCCLLLLPLIHWFHAARRDVRCFAHWLYSGRQHPAHSAFQRALCGVLDLVVLDIECALDVGDCAQNAAAHCRRRTLSEARIQTRNANPFSSPSERSIGQIPLTLCVCVCVCAYIVAEDRTASTK